MRNIALSLIAPKAALVLGLVSSIAITGVAGVLKGGLQILKKHFGFYEC